MIDLLIAVVDYGVGNLKSVEKALLFIGCKVCVSSDPCVIECSDAVVLPGVGAFSDAMDGLEKTGLAEVVLRSIERGKPFLGICLGLQLLFEYSEEGEGERKGLGVLRGSVKRFPDGMGLKIPHMGWNRLNIKADSLISPGNERPFVYFVHSYHAYAADRKVVAATSIYGIEFDAAVCRDNILATQFHPEKSGRTGIKMLKNWVRGCIK